MERAKKVLIFPNGNVAVLDEDGEQIPELQGSWINFDYLRKLAQVIAINSPEVMGELPIDESILAAYVKHYEGGKG